MTSSIEHNNKAWGLIVALVVVMDMAVVGLEGAVIPKQAGGNLHFKPRGSAGNGAGAAGGGLSEGFYKETCPKSEEVIKAKVEAIIAQNPSQAAGLLRLMFHDCFVQGCDASILLEKPATEQSATPNVGSLRASSLRAVEAVKAALEQECPGIVSCADTLALAATFAVHLVGGPYISIATGRRDSLSAASNQTVTNSIPPPTLSISALKQNFQNHGLNTQDLVALSGGHTIGQAHCRVVNQQLTPSVSADLNAKVAADLSRICLPASNLAKAGLTVHLDFASKDAFDNSYFNTVLAGAAVFHTDAELLRAPDTKQLVEEYAHDQQQFFEQFKVSMVKMSQLGVLTGDKGVIRKECTIADHRA